eukprot:TRINITY_DN5454_c0_g2_i2.p1 TRINITY_DN5454_c0_g2~~TRINITY_DN5454_c0_g2_i2.p1  ORF type:complete len:334 (-),score=100.31 TRINITY_DN5454_c0_g2_i2:42-1043(-)
MNTKNGLLSSEQWLSALSVLKQTSGPHLVEAVTQRLQHNVIPSVLDTLSNQKVQEVINRVQAETTSEQAALTGVRDPNELAKRQRRLGRSQQELQALLRYQVARELRPELNAAVERVFGLLQGVHSGVPGGKVHKRDLLQLMQASHCGFVDLVEQAPYEEFGLEQFHSMARKLCVLVGMEQSIACFNDVYHEAVRLGSQGPAQAVDVHQEGQPGCVPPEARLLAKARERWDQTGQGGALEGTQLLQLADWGMQSVVEEGAHPIGELERISTAAQLLREADGCEAGRLEFEGFAGWLLQLSQRMLHPSREPQPCLLYTSPSPRDRTRSRMPSSA